MNCLTENEVQEMYDNFLDEIYEEAGSPFNLSGSRVLSETDPIAYRCGLSDYMDSLASDGYIIEDYNDENIHECETCGDLFESEEESPRWCSLECKQDRR